METGVEIQPPRHTFLVRLTHWLTVICFILLLLTGAEIVVSHPRFYWGEEGNVNTPALFILPIPASRNLVPTGYHFVLPDENGWSRYLHFQTAWILVSTGLVYCAAGLLNGHFSRRFLARNSRSGKDAYGFSQRTAYLAVIFLLFPFVIWTGLALSPALDSAFPPLVTLLGGRQSARTLHFFASAALLIFLIAHVTMIARSGFRRRMRAMIMGSWIGSPPRP